MKTAKATSTNLSAETIEEFKNQLRGELIQPEDPAYDEARKLYNAMIDKRPRMIAKCANVADVITCVNFGRANELLTSIRSGGHNGPGLGLCDDGLAIDLSNMKGIYVDPENKTARVETGNTLGDVDHATHAFGLALPSGIISTTGVGGITLGGGMGYLTRKYGLTIDNLLEANIVIADGSYVTANKDKNSDLFWAVKGGGGNFGVVTSFLFQLHPAHTNYSGPMFWPIEMATEVLRFYKKFMNEASDDMYGLFTFLVVPASAPFPEELHNQNVCAVIWNYTGPLDQAEQAFEPIRNFRTPILDFVGPMPHPVLNSLFDKFYPTGLQWYWRGDFIHELSDEAIAEHVKFGSSIPTALSTMHLFQIDGLASRVGKTDTPWNYRDAKWSHVIVGVDPDPANANKITQWCKDYFDATHPYSAGGGYVNFMMEEGRERIKDTYGDNYDRLTQIKKKYDPNNFFRVNQNIEPVD